MLGCLVFEGFFYGGDIDFVYCYYCFEGVFGCCVVGVGDGFVEYVWGDLLGDVLFVMVLVVGVFFVVIVDDSVL